MTANASSITAIKIVGPQLSLRISFRGLFITPTGAKKIIIYDGRRPVLVEWENKNFTRD
jgi:hypothetical protein